MSWRARNGVRPGSGEPNELGAALNVALKCAASQEAAHIREIDGHVAEQPEEESGRNAARDGQRVEQLDQDGGHEVERASVDGGEGVAYEEARAPLPLLGRGQQLGRVGRVGGEQPGEVNRPEVHGDMEALQMGRWMEHVGGSLSLAAVWNEEVICSCRGTKFLSVRRTNNFNLHGDC